MKVRMQCSIHLLVLELTNQPFDDAQFATLADQEPMEEDYDAEEQVSNKINRTYSFHIS